MPALYRGRLIPVNPGQRGYTRLALGEGAVTAAPRSAAARTAPVQRDVAGPSASAPVAADAFSELYAAHTDRVYRYLLARTGRRQDAEELTSRVFTRAFAGLDGYRGGGKAFAGWVLTIAHNLLANWYRDRGRRPPTATLEAALGVPDDVPGPESTLERREDIRRVRRAIEPLAPDRQQLLALKYARGLSNAEIGRIMGRTEGAVKALHHRTLRQLQEALREPAPTPAGDRQPTGRGRK